MKLHNASGVYQITCLPTGKTYIGSAKMFRTRWNLHRTHLRANRHDSKHMQHSWNKYGPDAFEFKILLVCDHSVVLVYEQIFLDALKPKFNTCKVAGNVAGVRHSDEAKKRMGAGQRAIRPKYEWRGQMLCLSDIAEIEDFDYRLLMARVIGLKKSVAESIQMGDPRKFRLHEYNGEKKLVSDWAREFGVHVARLNHYIKQGLTVAEAKARIDRSEKAMSLQWLCAASEGAVTLTTAKSRIQKGVGVLEALFTPPDESRSHRPMKEFA